MNKKYLFQIIVLTIIVPSWVWVVFSQSETLNEVGPIYMDWNQTVDLFTEQEPNATAKSYIDGLVIMRQEKKEWESVALARQRRQIVRTFCDTVLRQREDIKIEPRYFDHQGYRYDPRQSLFMYGMCVTFDERRGWTPKDYKKEVFTTAPSDYPENSSFVMKNHWDEDKQAEDYPLVTLRGLPSEPELDAEGNAWKYPCDPKGTMQLCDFSTRTTKMYRTLMNEIVTMRQATVYWYRFLDLIADPVKQEQQIQQAVKEFSHKYFTTWEDGTKTCNSPEMHYLSTEDTWAWEWNRKHCVHPKTNKIVADGIRDNARMLESLNYLKSEEFFKKECDIQAKKAELYTCAMSNFWDKPLESDTRSFHNVLLNELMRYNLFTTYYLNNLTTNNNFAPASVSIVSSLNSVRDEVAVLTYEQQLSTKAVETTMRILDNIQTTYPMHIGMQAYLEDIKWYRKQLGKIHTPMHQLYYLLRNVQSCEE